MKKSMLQKCIGVSMVALSMFGGVFGVTAKAETVDEQAPKRYVDAPVASSRAVSTEYIDFASKQTEEYVFPYNVPYYYSTTLSNACGPIGGGIIVGYYDKYYENLISNYTAYYTASGRYRLQDDVYVPAMLQELYTAMQTNVVAAGVSEQECLDGLEACVEGKGYSINYTTVKTVNTDFNFTTYKNQIDSGNPVLLFCNSVQLLDLGCGETQDVVSTGLSSADHIVVGFGYCKYYYYDANGNNFRTETYLKIATGWASTLTGYIRVSDGASLDSGFAVDIY